MLCEKEVQQLWSPGLEKFLADRFVEGTCPLVSHFVTEEGCLFQMVLILHGVL